MATMARDPFDLTGHVAVVTGAASGIGRATAIALASAGARTFCADLERAGAEETVRTIGADGGKAAAIELDVRDRREVDAAIRAIADEQGRLDVLANVAGVITQGPGLEVTEDELDGVLAVNLKGVLWGCQAAGRVMAAQGRGSIINMASQAIDSPTPGLLCYAVSKAGVAQLTRVFAAELGPSGVRVNTVAPGFVVTAMTSRHFTRPDGTLDEAAKDAYLAPMAEHLPLRRIGQAEDVASTVLYLASDASSFVTGQTLRPNGGGTMP